MFVLGEAKLADESRHSKQLLADLGVDVKNQGAPHIPKKAPHEKYYWFEDYNHIISNSPFMDFCIQFENICFLEDKLSRLKKFSLSETWMRGSLCFSIS